MRFSKLSLATLFVFAAAHAQAQVVVTINNPGVQTTTVAGATTENFDSFATGTTTTLNSTIGTYTSPGMAVVLANQFGGAGGAGKYFAIGTQSGQLTSTLTFSAGNQGYFGFWFSAGDSLNKVQLYKDSALLYTLDTAGLINFINSRPDKTSYYGNPNTGANSGQPYAYVNFFGTNGTEFNKVVFSNASLSSGFESDNHSVAASAPVTGIPITPEPGATAMLVGMSVTGAGFLRRRKQIRKGA